MAEPSLSHNKYIWVAGGPKRTPKVPAAGTTQSFLVAQLGAPVHLGGCAELDESYSAIDVSMLKKVKTTWSQQSPEYTIYA